MVEGLVDLLAELLILVRLGLLNDEEERILKLSERK